MKISQPSTAMVVKNPLLWMDEILHHFEAMVETIFLLVLRTSLVQDLNGLPPKADLSTYEKLPIFRDTSFRKFGRTFLFLVSVWLIIAANFLQTLVSMNHGSFASPLAWF